MFGRVAADARLKSAQSARRQVQGETLSLTMQKKTLVPKACHIWTSLCKVVLDHQLREAAVLPPNTVPVVHEFA